MVSQSQEENVLRQREHYDLRFATPMQACIASPSPHQPTPMGSIVALVERGSCDFARKVRAAQVRGAKAVIVGDGKAREEETEEEGRERENLITMFSPGTSLFPTPISSPISRATPSSFMGPPERLNCRLNCRLNSPLATGSSERTRIL